MLYQHHQNHVTQPLIHEEVLDVGIDISTGRSTACRPKGPRGVPRGEGLLLAAREVSAISRPTTGGPRHQVKNAYTTVIANPLLRLVHHHGSKSRVNFLKLCGCRTKSTCGARMPLRYAEFQGLSLMLRARLASTARKGVRISPVTKPGNDNWPPGKSAATNRGESSPKRRSSGR